MAQALRKLRLNSPGVKALLKDPGVQSDLTRRANAISSSLPTGNGEEWQVNSFTGHDRAQAVIKTANSKARRTVADRPASMLAALASGR